MVDVLEILSWILDLFLTWRLFISLCITAGIIFLVCTAVHDPTARWVIGSPIALAGVILGFRWQNASD